MCERAAKAEKDAGDFERKSRERRRFLEGRQGARNAALQSLRAQTAQVRQVLPMIRRGISAAGQDQGIVPGLSQYFLQMDTILSSALQAVDACLAAPEHCNPPAFACPVPPNIPVFTKNVQSADTIRRIQADYRRAADQAYQACRTLNTAVSRESARLAEDAGASSAGDGTQRIGDIDLYLVKAGNLKREAARLRVDADREAGMRDYCVLRLRPGGGAPASGPSPKAAAAGPGRPFGGRVADLKADWDAKWRKEISLAPYDVPLPEGNAPGDGGMLSPIREYLNEKAPWWWYRMQSAYRKADEQVELTEFIESRPTEMVKDVVVEYVESSFGAFGKSLTTGYKILGAVKATSGEVGEILAEAPGVIAYGGGDEAARLSERSGRVPLKMYDELFNDVSGGLPAPRYDYTSGKGIPQ